MDIAGNAEQALRMVVEADDLVFDTETSGVDWKTNAPVGYVLGAMDERGVAPENLVYVPVRHGGGGNIMGGRPLSAPDAPWEVHEFEKALADAFDERNRLNRPGRIVGHHMKFDVHFAANAGIMLGRRLACTQNQEAMLDEYVGKYSLAASAERHGVTMKLGDELYRHLSLQFGGAPDRKQMANFWRTAGNDPLVVEYTLGDGISTAELYRVQQRLLAEEEMELVAQMENDLIWTVFRMERRGIKVDLDRVAELRHATEAQIGEALSSFKPGFNPRSPLDMKEAMTNAGYDDWPLTAKGAPSFTEKYLKTKPLGQKIVEIRQLTNLLNSFVNPLVERHVHKGRVHATLNQLKNDDRGTVSGRFSCSDPNLQQVPKHNKKLARPFRRLFVPDEGFIFWERDYSQCEPRLFAHYSEDENLTAGYNAQPFVDAHSTTAKLLGVERDPTAKRMNMGIFTGMQYRALAGHMGIDEQLAWEYHNRWFDTYPSIRRFQETAKVRLRKRGFVKTILGRRCRLEEPKFAYRGTSKVIQGSNADIVKWKLLEADRACEDGGDIVQVHMTVHDSFNGQFQDTPEARELFEQIVRDMAEVQTEPFNLKVPFVLEGEEGGDWAEASFGKEK